MAKRRKIIPAVLPALIFCSGSALASVPDGIYDLVVAGEKTGVAIVEDGKFTRPVQAGICQLTEATGALKDNTLTLDIPDNCFTSKTLDMRSEKGPLRFADSNSWYLNASASTTDGEKPSVNLASGLFLGNHYLYSDAYLDTRYDTYNRGRSYAERDMPSIHSRLVVGDLNAETESSLISGKQLGGIKFARNWAQDPDRAATVYYTSSHKLRLASRSTIEFYRDGQIVDRRELPAGEYDIRNLPAAAYASTLRLKITDAYGAITEIDVDVINPPKLLSKGTLDYNFSLGLERIGFKEQGEYRKLTGGGYIGYGLTEWLSLFASVYDKEVTGTASVATPIGLFSGEVQLDKIRDYRAAYSYSWRNVSVSAEYREQDKKQRANASVGLGLDTFGSLTARFISGDNQSYGLSHNVSLPWSLSMLTQINFARTGEVGYSAGLTKQWSSRLSTQVTYTKGVDRSDTLMAQLTFSLDRMQPAAVGLQASSTTRDGKTSVNTRSEGRYGLYASVSTSTPSYGPTVTTATVAGAVACAGGQCRVGEPVTSGFAVGDNVQSSGQTGSIIPVPAYSNTALTASTRTAIETTVVAVRPGQGVYLSAADKISVQAVIMRNGQPVKSAIVTWDGGETITGEDGLLWLPDQKQGRAVRLNIDGESVVLMLDREAESGILDMGNVVISSALAGAKAPREGEKI